MTSHGESCRDHGAVARALSPQARQVLSGAGGVLGLRYKQEDSAALGAPGLGCLLSTSVCFPGVCHVSSPAR